MFYPFKPAKALGRSGHSPDVPQPKPQLEIAKLTAKIRASTRIHPGIGKLSLIVAPGLVGAAVAGILFFEGIFSARPTIFKIDLGNTLLGERIQPPQGVARQRELDLYLDSLDKAVTADSIKNLEIQNSTRHADTKLH
jgi:hypothetical protein